MGERDDHDRSHPAVRRLRHDPEVVAALDTLARLNRGDLTTALLEVLSERTSRMSTAEVRRLHTADRFVRPSTVDALRLAELRLDGLRALADDYEPIELAPLAPLGAHTAFARVDPRNVVTTERQSEVSADPTNQLALVAAERIRAGEAATRLVATQHVIRAQRFEGPMSFAHFSLLGVVSTARGRRTADVDRRLAAEVAGDLARAAARLTDHPILVAWADVDGAPPPPELARRVAQLDGVVLDDDASTSLRETMTTDYYRTVRFGFSADTPDGVVGIGDGGAVDWLSALLDDRTACLVTGALSLDRLALS